MKKRVQEFDKIIRASLNKKENRDEKNSIIVYSPESLKYFADSLKEIKIKIDEDKIDEALILINRMRRKNIKIENLNALRAICFIKKGLIVEAKESLLEELSVNENNSVAKDLLSELGHSLKFIQPNFKNENNKPDMTKEQMITTEIKFENFAELKSRAEKNRFGDWLVVINENLKIHCHDLLSFYMAFKDIFGQKIYHLHTDKKNPRIIKENS